jgi:hypothetical protein
MSTSNLPLKLLSTFAEDRVSPAHQVHDIHKYSACEDVHIDSDQSRGLVSTVQSYPVVLVRGPPEGRCNSLEGNAAQVPVDVDAHTARICSMAQWKDGRVRGRIWFVRIWFMRYKPDASSAHGRSRGSSTVISNVATYHAIEICNVAFDGHAATVAVRCGDLNHIHAAMFTPPRNYILVRSGMHGRPRPGGCASTSSFE